MAECGGMMFLTRSLTVRQGGTAYAMTGILPLDCTMVGARLHLGYRRIEYKGMEPSRARISLFQCRCS